MIETLFLDGLDLHESENFSITRFKIGTPAPRVAMTDQPSESGSLDVTRLYGPRIYEVEGELWADSMAEFWTAYDALVSAFQLSRALKLMQFTREGRSFAERALVRVNSELDVPLENIAPFAKWGVSLLAPDPRIYSDTLSSGLYDPTTTGVTGFDFPITFPLAFGESSPFTVSNGGNTDTLPTFTIAGPMTSGAITNETTGDSIEIVAALDTAETLVIECATRRVLLNGETDRPDYIDVAESTWIRLVPGLNRLRLSGSGFETGETELSVTFREARMG